MGKEAVAHRSVDTESLQFVLGVKVAETITIGKGGSTSHDETVTAQVLHLANILSQGLRRIGRKDIGLAPRGKIGRIATVKGLAEIGLEMVIHAPAAAAAVLSGMAGDETLTIGRHHILHIICVLQTSLYLQGAHPRPHQFLQMVYLAKVLEREQVLVVDDGGSMVILEVEGETAKLSTGAAVGRPLEAILRGVAQSAIADA